MHLVSWQPLGYAAMFGMTVAGSTAAAAPAAQGAIEFAPHRAVYEVTLERTTPGSGIADLAGRMVYELKGSACEGYEQNYRYVTVSADQEGTTQTGDLRSTTFEGPRGSELRFSTKQFQNQKLSQSTDGVAARKSGSGAITVELGAPEKQQLSFPPVVYFPMQHSAALIAAARAGKTVFSADIYDGSEKGVKVSGTTAFIGREAAPGTIETPRLAERAKLAAVPSWPISISFFEPNTDKMDAVPAAEQTYRFYANGVSTELVSDFGEYTLRFELSELLFLDAKPCAGH